MYYVYVYGTQYFLNVEYHFKFEICQLYGQVMDIANFLPVIFLLSCWMTMPKC